MLSCFYVQQRISEEDRYYYSLYFNEFEEKTKLESMPIHIELIDLSSAPKKLANSFPEVANDLNPNESFIIHIGMINSCLYKEPGDR